MKPLQKNKFLFFLIFWFFHRYFRILELIFRKSWNFGGTKYFGDFSKKIDLRLEGYTVSDIDTVWECCLGCEQSLYFQNKYSKCTEFALGRLKLLPSSLVLQPLQCLTSDLWPALGKIWIKSLIFRYLTVLHRVSPDHLIVCFVCFSDSTTR